MCASGFTFISSNVDSYLNKREEIAALIEEKKPKLIALQEIKAKRQKKLIKSEYSIPNYDLFINKDPRLGVAIYAHKSLNAIECEVLNDDAFQESVWCSFETSLKERVLIGCIYKSPTCTDENKENLFTLLLKPEIQKYDKVCIVGDFNYPGISWNGKWNGQKDLEFIECLRDAYLCQMVTEPTRRRKAKDQTLTT